MKRTKNASYLAVIIGILFATGMTFSGMLKAEQRKMVPVASGEEDEHEDSDEGDDEEDEDDEKDDDEEKDDDDEKDEENDDEDEASETRRVRTTAAQKSGVSEDEDDDAEEGDDEDDEEDVQDEIKDLKEEIAEMETKIAKLSSRGVDMSVFSSALAEVKDLVSQAEAKLLSAPAEAKALAARAENRLEDLDDLIEVKEEDEDELDEADDENETEDDEDEAEDADEYRSNVAQFVHNLKTVEKVDGGIGQRVRVVAQAQNESRERVDKEVVTLEGRSGVVKFLIGPNLKSLEKINNEVTYNQARIQALSDMSKRVADPVVQNVLKDQIKLIRSQNESLKNLVKEQESSFSLFGWLIKLFY